MDGRTMLFHCLIYNGATGILLFSFNLIDLVIVDWLVFCTITPEFIVIPGTEGHPGYRNYRYHFLAFLKGTVFSVAGAHLFAGISAGVAWIV